MKSLKSLFKCNKATPADKKKDADIFTIEVRRCKKCGRLLTGKDAVQEGYGHTCKTKICAEEEAKKQIDGQLSILDLIENKE